VRASLPSSSCCAGGDYSLLRPSHAARRDRHRGARDELIEKGAKVSEIFHDAGNVFHHGGLESRVAGPAPDNKSYGSFASFSDPDGNTWFLQEVTTRLPGR
jgi:hypothetical protein